MSLTDTYIKEITELLPKCDDESLLDLIYQLLSKRVARASRLVDSHSQD
jgi:hypothetical protein